ncbi:MAG: DUF4276 family protein [Proteobacteria bacterium]|nr:DUF4276 family protein [Pseudomonadota bacterium]
MARVLIHVEGQTEESFVNSVLAPHLYAHGYTGVAARLLGNARQRDRRGGIRPWHAVRGDILRHLNQDRVCLATTMVDYYALPATGAAAWPGRAAAGTLGGASADIKAVTVEAALAADIGRAMGSDFDPPRFLPFVVMHEFEGLLFSDCAGFGRGIGRPDLGPPLQQIRSQFGTPEEINDSPLTAPSKRVEALVSGYQKPLHGVLAARAIGLDAIGAACPHFRDWLERLEAWPAR